MRNGRLLAMDTPSNLKTTALPERAWNVFVGGLIRAEHSPGVAKMSMEESVTNASPLLAALAALEGCPCVLRAGLVGDYLRAITPFDAEAADLRERLAEAGIGVVDLELAEPTLEDVFLALASR
jgi:hypothetical protein